MNKNQSRDSIECTESLITDEDEEMLPVVQAPFLPPTVSNNKEYTLVLDLDETLIHYCDISEDSNTQSLVGTFLIRPGALNFLREMS